MYLISFFFFPPDLCNQSFSSPPPQRRLLVFQSFSGIILLFLTHWISCLVPPPLTALRFWESLDDSCCHARATRGLWEQRVGTEMRLMCCEGCNSLRHPMGLPPDWAPLGGQTSQTIGPEQRLAVSDLSPVPPQCWVAVSKGAAPPGLRDGRSTWIVFGFGWPVPGVCHFGLRSETFSLSSARLPRYPQTCNFPSHTHFCSGYFFIFGRAIFSRGFPLLVSVLPPSRG